MYEQTLVENAVAAIRVSTTKQGTDGDSPEAQKEQLEQFAKLHNINLKKTFIFLESASKATQPMQEAIDYCKNPKNDIQLFIIKSIDRFTRGGATPYDQLKMQLETYGVKLVDIYGVISSRKVNTLEHLNVKYKWSEYSPSQKTEFLEAERAKDELRDIMSRMIGAEVRYTRMGYWMRRPPYGYDSMPIDTNNGKRRVLKPHPTESDYIIKMFDLRARGTLSDSQIVDRINNLGYGSRKFNYHDRINKSAGIQKGGYKLNIKQFWSYIHKPIYSGVINEKWTEYKPIKAKFDGLVSYETFNAANRGKIVINEQDGVISMHTRPAPEHLVAKGARNADFPYRKVIMCPGCEMPLFGSASRGGTGKHYPAYHCNKRGHYFRVPKEEFESTIESFVHKVTFSQDYIDKLSSAVEIVWRQRQQVVNKEEHSIDMRINELKAQALATVDKIKFLSSETAIKYMEEDLMRIEAKLAELTSEKEQKTSVRPISFEIVMKYAKYFLEHIDYLLLQQSDPVKRANFFGVIFDKLPTYQTIFSGTEDVSKITGINELFKVKGTNQSLLVPPGGFEPSASP